MANEIIEMRSINELLGYHFIVPSFQRGYRWQEQQVDDLLDDIYEYMVSKEATKGDFYCLQPIIICEKNGQYILIDGQQRLTTIFIILSFLSEIMKLYGYKESFALSYEKRPDSESFLKNIDMSKRNDNIDYYHICDALETIEFWFDQHDPGVKPDFLRTLLRKEDNNVQVIWYEVDDTHTNLIDIFTRINMGKIPLTNAELIKALFLRRREEAELSRLRQHEIAGEWDRMEYSLRDKNFWFFLHNTTKGYDNRIELLFELIENQKSLDKYHTFRFFNEKINSSKDVEEYWLSIKKDFQTLEEWYNNKVYYHLVGYLIATGTSLSLLLKNSANKTKRSFRSFLIDLIRKKVDYQSLAELDYEEDPNEIRLALLLFNVLTIMQNSSKTGRFSFANYKEEHWDIEHIHSS